MNWKRLFEAARRRHAAEWALLAAPLVAVALVLAIAPPAGCGAFPGEQPDRVVNESLSALDAKPR